MKYTAMTGVERDALWNELERLTRFLEERFSSLSPEEAVRPGPGGAFSPVEQCWHLADLEREGFGERIRRLRSEREPLLPVRYRGRVRVVSRPRTTGGRAPDSGHEERRPCGS